MEQPESQTIVIEKNGHKVSITPNEVKAGSNTYKVYRVRTTILGERKTQTAKTLEDAKKKANALLAQLKDKGGIIATYTPQQVTVIESALESCTKAKVTLSQAVNGYVEAAQYLPAGVSLVEAVRGYVARVAKESIKPMTVAALVKKYKESIKDTSDVHKRTVGPRLDRAAKHFQCNVSDITAGDVDQWLRGLEVGPLTRNHHRVALSSLMRFAQLHDHLQDGLTATDKVKPAKKQEKAIEAYTPAEAFYLASNIEERWKPYVALGLFAGIRPQEILNLQWEDIKADHIEIRASGSKVGVRRIVPLLPNLTAWLKPNKQESGPVSPVFKGGDMSRQQSLGKAMRATIEAAVKEAKAPEASMTAKELGTMKVIYDGLRHSFISYRLAIVKDFPQVAMEAGNSIEVIQSHYNKRATEAEAKTFFSLIPPKAPGNILQMGKTKAA